MEAGGTVMRNNTHRAERLADLIRRELGELIEYEIKDPRVGLVAVTAVQVAENLHRVRVFVRVPGDESEQQASLQRLTAAQSFLRHELAQRLGLRHTPEIFLHLDKTPGGEQPPAS
jgi:ribosome-binding factor A